MSLRFWVEGNNVLLGEKYKLNAENFPSFMIKWIQITFALINTTGTYTFVRVKIYSCESKRYIFVWTAAKVYQKSWRSIWKYI